MQYYLVKDLKTKKVYLLRGTTLEKAREALQGVIGAPLLLEWVCYASTANEVMVRFGVHRGNTYWAEMFQRGEVQDVTRLIDK